MGITYYSGAILVVFITLTFTTTINGADVNCTQFITSLECCEKGPSNCSWVDDCKDKNNNKTVAGCFNNSLLNTTCSAYTKTQCSTVPQVNCTTLNETECCKHVVHDCMYANCSSGSKKFIGCFNSTDVTCSPKVDQCTVTTTSSSTSTTTTPTTTTTKSSTTTPAPTLPVPPAKECETFNESVCCSQKIYRCIWVNCSRTDNLTAGCFSEEQVAVHQKSCKPGTYWNYCEPITTTPAATSTPKPASTTAAHVQPPDSERHFDGASFIGGIVLCAGIVLLIFFGIKFYRSRKAGNDYHHM